MKKIYLFIALAMVAGLTVSCKNHKKAEADAATEEVVEAAKVILSDDVLATIDEFAQQFMDKEGTIYVPALIASKLSEEDKLIKPDYLLDPAIVNNLVTKNQKINALAILVADRNIRKAYDMPMEEAEEAIARLYAELNHPVNNDTDGELSASQKLRKTYDMCKERGEIGYFWQFCFGLIQETQYLISYNADVFFDNVTEEQFQAFLGRLENCIDAVKTLADYDPEVKEAWDIFCSACDFKENHEEARKVMGTIEGARAFYSSRKEAYDAHRVDLFK